MEEGGQARGHERERQQKERQCKMKFSITRTKFVDALRNVQNLVSSKMPLQVMQNVLVEAEGGVLRLTTADMDVTMYSVAEADIGEPGSTTLPAKVLFGVVSCCPEGVVEVEVDADDRASIRAGSAKYRLVGMSAKLFPALPDEGSEEGYRIDQAVLREMLRKTAYAAPQDDTRKALKGVLMSFQDGRLSMVATDGRRLALVEKELEDPIDRDMRITIPIRTVVELQRILSGDGRVEIKLNGSRVRFDFGSTVLYSKIVEDRYPDYEQVIPRKCNYSVALDRQQLVTALERVSVMTSDVRSTMFTFSGNMLQISSRAANLGEARDEVPIKYDGERIDISFNPVYILEALKAIDDDEVKINLNEGTTPAVIKCSIPFLYVIMPLKVD